MGIGFPHVGVLILQGPTEGPPLAPGRAELCAPSATPQVALGPGRAGRAVTRVLILGLAKSFVKRRETLLPFCGCETEAPSHYAAGAHTPFSPGHPAQV